MILLKILVAILFLSGLALLIGTPIDFYLISHNGPSWDYGGLFVMMGLGFVYSMASGCLLWLWWDE